ncbi:hypothetical protein Tco_1034277 [Tanacetum coccineum]
MLQALQELTLQVKKGLLSAIIVRVKGIWQVESGQELDDEQLAFLADPRVLDANAVLMANLSSYDSDILSEMSKQMSNHVTNWDKAN